MRLDPTGGCLERDHQPAEVDRGSRQDEQDGDNR
jgi:hypothetical protein